MDFAEIHVDQKYHRHIIGKGGASGEYTCVQCIDQSLVTACIAHAIFMAMD